MRKYNFLFMVLSILLVIQFFSYMANKEILYINEIGQVEVERIKKNSSNNLKRRACSKKILYSGSINIIEKYLTIYMILFVFSFYIKGRYIENNN